MTSEADFRGSNIATLDLTNGLFKKANFSKLDLRQTKLLGANLAGANMHECNISGHKLSTFTVRLLNNWQMIFEFSRNHL